MSNIDRLDEILYERAEDLTDVQHIKLRKAILAEYIPIKEVLEAIGKDEDASWQKIWQGGKSHKIDDPAITAQNELRAEIKSKLNLEDK